MLENLKKIVYEQNMKLQEFNLVKFTWGNVSAISPDRDLIVIKPSGVAYKDLKWEDMVVVNLNGEVVEGQLNPSSDTLIHIELYKNSNDIGGIVHTHSTWATSWAQAGKDIPCYGTTHADYFYKEIPCIPVLSSLEIESDYERNTGLSIANYYKKNLINFLEVPSALCQNHGTFSWGKSAEDALHNAVVLEEVAKMATLSFLINPNIESAPKSIIEKHYQRKHGKNAYYGQK